MARFLFVLHQSREQAATLARKTIEWLTDGGHQVIVLDHDAAQTGLTRWAVPTLDGQRIDLAVSLGGDGTMLRTLDMMCPLGTPVLGVNIGHLGYLTELEPDRLRDGLTRFIAGDYKVEERMTLEVVVTSAAESDPTKSTISLSRQIAVNEVVVEKTTSGATVRLEVLMNGRSFLNYAVDGMIVATATGSTAYNLSARGPILSPTLNAILMTPVSPHMLFDRSLVMNGDERLELRVIGTRSASVVVDGRQLAIIGAGGVVSCQRSANPAHIVTFGDRDFREILKAKFGLADR